jgi:hypothetical protein
MKGQNDTTVAANSSSEGSIALWVFFIRFGKQNVNAYRFGESQSFQKLGVSFP